MKPTVFLGGGRITTALVAGLRLAGDKSRIIVVDHHRRKVRHLKRQYGVIAESDLHRAVEAAGLLVIAVRPSSVRGLLAEIGKVNRPVVVVSLAAGIPLARIRGSLGPRVQWARAMPSPACRTLRGLTAVAFSRQTSSRARRLVKSFFAKVGAVIEIPERKFDAFTVTYSCSHGYHALATFADAARRVGLDRSTALTAAAHALADGILSWREGDTSLPELLHEAATPGGIAATVMSAMDKDGYRHLVEKSLRAGIARARANAKS